MTQVIETNEPSQPIERRRVRPLGVVLLVLFQVLIVGATLLALAGVLGPRTGSLVAILGNDSLLIDALLVGLAALSLVAAVGLWLLRRAGWYAVMLLTGFGLAVQIVLYVVATPNFINMLILVTSAFYLNQRQVKSIFLEPHRDAQPVLLAVEEEVRP